MSGHLAVVGIGPGDARWLTPEAQAALDSADALYGYGPYLDRVPARPGQSRHPSDNREEMRRAADALTHAAQGARVARPKAHHGKMPAHGRVSQPGTSTTAKYGAPSSCLAASGITTASAVVPRST